MFSWLCGSSGEDQNGPKSSEKLFPFLCQCCWTGKAQLETIEWRTYREREREREREKCTRNKRKEEGGREKLTKVYKQQNQIQLDSVDHTNLSKVIWPIRPGNAWHLIFQTRVCWLWRVVINHIKNILISYSDISWSNLNFKIPTLNSIQYWIGKNVDRKKNIRLPKADKENGRKRPQ